MQDLYLLEGNKFSPWHDTDFPIDFVVKTFWWGSILPGRPEINKTDTPQWRTEYPSRDSMLEKLILPKIISDYKKQ